MEGGGGRGEKKNKETKPKSALMARAGQRLGRASASPAHGAPLLAALPPLNPPAPRGPRGGLGALQGTEGSGGARRGKSRARPRTAISTSESSASRRPRRLLLTPRSLPSG